MSGTGEARRVERPMDVGKAGTRELTSSKFRSGISRFSALSRVSYSFACSIASEEGVVWMTGDLEWNSAYIPRPMAATKAAM